MKIIRSLCLVAAAAAGGLCEHGDVLVVEGAGDFVVETGGLGVDTFRRRFVGARRHFNGLPAVRARCRGRPACA